MPYPTIDEMRTLANQLLNEQETCLPWEPIPARFARNWLVDVIHVTEDYGVDRQPADNFTVALAAKVDPTGTTTVEFGAWRIDFTGCEAYRKRIVNYEGAAPLLTRPSKVGAAFWEISGSHYLVESGVWASYYPQVFHHYVIVSAIHTVHEVLARDWRCRPLPQAWALPFTGPMPAWPPMQA